MKSKKFKLTGLIERIAREIQTTEDAEYVVEQLATITKAEWQQFIQKEAAIYINREVSRIRRANVRAARKELPATLTLDDWIKTLHHFEYRCAYCQLPFSYDHLEHVVPLVSGRAGTTADNCVPSCRACNRRKHDKDIMYWVQMLLQKHLPLDIPVDDFAQRVTNVHRFLRSTYPHQYVIDLDFQKIEKF